MRTEIASYFKAQEREREKSVSLRFVPVGISADSVVFYTMWMEGSSYLSINLAMPLTFPFTYCGTIQMFNCLISYLQNTCRDEYATSVCAPQRCPSEPPDR